MRSNLKKENADLQGISEFINKTQQGDYTKNYSLDLNISFGRTEISNTLENSLVYIDTPQILYFGLTY